MIDGEDYALLSKLSPAECISALPYCLINNGQINWLNFAQDNVSWGCKPHLSHTKFEINK